VAVIADDLTGAADTGIQFTRAGYRTGVALFEAAAAAELDALAVDTDSRELPEAEAVKRTGAVARSLKHVPILFKKIDSTLRGPMGAEVRAAAQGGERRRMVVAPAFPSAGRTTSGGVQCVDGRPLEDGDVTQRLADGGCGDAVVLPRDQLQCVGAALRAHACVVADAQDESDLVALARGVPDPTAVLWAGSAGLAAALAEVHAGPRPPAAPTRPQGGPVLVVIGSGHPVAREQVRRLAAAAAVDVPLDLDDLAATTRRAAAALAGERSVVVHATTCSGGDEVSARIPGALARVAAALAEDVQSLVLSGGETAVHVARALGVRGLALEHELERGVPVSRLIGPRPLRVVTKAGGFGGPLALVRAVEALGGRVGAAL
jgi:uncharacterized protein YgbK (DUF1537 family)